MLNKAVRLNYQPAPERTFTTSAQLLDRTPQGWTFLAHFTGYVTPADGYWVLAVDRHLKLAALRIVDRDGERTDRDSETRPANLEQARWRCVAQWAAEGLADGPNDPMRDALATAAKKLPTHQQVQRLYARSLCELKQYVHALTVFDALTGAPLHADRAAALVGLERYEEALAAADTALQQRDSRAALALRGIALEALGDKPAALAAFVAALSIPERKRAIGDDDAKVPLVHGQPLVAGAALLAQELQQHQIAVQLLHPFRIRSAAALTMLEAKSLQALGRITDATQALERARELGHPEAVSALLELQRQSTLKPVSKPKPPAGDIDLGDRVLHKKFGEGLVVDIDDGRNTMVTVEFDSEERTLPLRALRVIGTER